MSLPATFVLVHGAFHGAWCWARLVPKLEALDARCVTVDLHRGGRSADIAAIQEVVDREHGDGRRVIAVGHSLGCASVVGLDPHRLAHVVFLAGTYVGEVPGFPPPQDAITPAFWDAVTTGEDGRMTIDRERALAVFYADCDEETARDAAARLIPDLTYGPPSPSDPPLWKVVPSTYLWCDEDAVVDPEHQRALAKHTRYGEGLATSHSPMLSAPDALAAALGRVLERT